MKSGSIIHTNLHKPNNKLVSAQLEHFWCTNEPRVNTDSQDSPWFGLGGSHHLPPYNILYTWPQGQHPNVILSRDSQVGNPKIPEIKTPTALEANNFLCKPLIEVRYKEKLQPLLKAFQWYVARHLHASKSGLFLIFNGSQIVTLTPAFLLAVSHGLQLNNQLSFSSLNFLSTNDLNAHKPLSSDY